MSAPVVRNGLSTSLTNALATPRGRLHIGSTFSPSPTLQQRLDARAVNDALLATHGNKVEVVYNEEARRHWPTVAFRGSRATPEEAFAGGLRPSRKPESLQGFTVDEIRQAAEGHANGKGPDGPPIDKIFFDRAAVPLSKSGRVACKFAVGRTRDTGWVLEVDVVKLLKKYPRLTIADANALGSTLFRWEHELQVWGGRVPPDCIVRALEAKKHPSPGGNRKEHSYMLTGVVRVNPSYVPSTSDEAPANDVDVYRYADDGNSGLGGVPILNRLPPSLNESSND